MSTTASTEPSNYIQTLTRYLSNIMNSTLLGLPREIKELIYYDALNHAAERILVSRKARDSSCYRLSVTKVLTIIPLQALPLQPEVKTINPNGVAAMAMDVQSLVEFVSGLDNSFMLMEVLQELEQTVKLLQAENADDFYDISVRNRHYGRVNAMNGPVLLEKLTHTVEAPNRAAATMANFSSRFGFKS